MEPLQLRSMKPSGYSPQADMVFKFLLESSLYSKLEICRKFKMNRQALNDLLGMMQPRFRSIGLKLVGINPSKASKNKNQEKSESHSSVCHNMDLICDPMDSEKIFVTRWYDFTSLKRKRVSINLKQKSSMSKNSLIPQTEEKESTETRSETKKLTRAFIDENSNTSEDILEENMQKTLKIYEDVQYTLPREYFIVFTIIFLESGTISLDRLVSYLSVIHITNHFFDPDFDEFNWTINEHSEDTLFHYKKKLKMDSTNIFTDTLIYKMKKEGYLRIYKDEDAQMHVTFDWRFHAECPSFNPTNEVENFCKLH